MTSTIIITVCSLLLIAYLFDLTSSRTRIPSVILLLALGYIVRQVTNFWGINMPDFTAVLEVFGTLGLILIVLEGSLELELNKSKLEIIKKSFTGSLIVMFALAFLFAFLFQYFGGYSLKNSLANAIPFCIMSSAIAIPSVRGLETYNREFIIYESSLSDIMGVLFFNFITLNATFDTGSFLHFGLQVLLIAVVSFAATAALSLLLSKIDHHIKFIPIILLIILIYTVSKVYHLPALIFILLFGIFLSNLDELKHLKWIRKLRTGELDKEVQKFKELTIEAAFLIRALFFLIFGYMIDRSEILNMQTLAWAVGIVSAIFLFRIIQLKLSKLPLSPLLYVAPRGLITVLLFLSIDASQKILLVNRSLIIQVVVLTALVMMAGLMARKKDLKA